MLEFKKMFENEMVKLKTKKNFILQGDKQKKARGEKSINYLIKNRLESFTGREETISIAIIEFIIHILKLFLFIESISLRANRLKY